MLKKIRICLSIKLTYHSFSKGQCGQHEIVTFSLSQIDKKRWVILRRFKQNVCGMISYIRQKPLVEEFIPHEEHT